MKTLTVDLPGREYDIVIDPGVLDRAGEHIKALCPRARLCAVVTDDTVGALYGHRLTESLKKAGFAVQGLTIAPGEPSKCPDNLVGLWLELAGMGLTRTDVVVALGGGVVGDLAGFAAATMLRGVDFIQIPTTLLAQVDSSVGGKVAIDLPSGKNLAGCFYQPKGVLMDPETLSTLPDETFADGMAEVIKYGAIFDANFFRFLAQRPSRDAVMADIEKVLYTCCDHKRRVVLADERDTGERMLLNFGHTLGHAYEKAGNYERWTHGQAVAAGMVAAAGLGVRLGMTPAEVPDQIAGLCAAFGLPTAIDCTMDDYSAAIGLDKKSAGGDIHLIVLESLGRAVARKMPKAELMGLLEVFTGAS